MGLLGEFGIPALFIIKLLVLFGLALYIVFALVVVRQVQLMTDTVDVGFETPVRMLAIVHLVFALAVFGLAMVVL